MPNAETDRPTLTASSFPPDPKPRDSWRPAPSAPVWDLDTIVPPAGEP